MPELPRPVLFVVSLAACAGMCIEAEAGHFISSQLYGFGYFFALHRVFKPWLEAPWR